MVSLRDMFGGAAAGSFLGVAQAAQDAPEGDIVIFGADCATPYASVGAYCAGGPAAVRAGTAAFAGHPGKYNFDIGGPVIPDGVRVVDLGDLPVDAEAAEANRSMIRTVTERVLQAGGVPVLLGGDDSLPTPMLMAYGGRGPLHILQIDAHIDWRDSVEGERWGLSSTMRRASEMDHVAGIVQVGQRGIGSASATEVAAARAWGACLVPSREIDSGGITRAIEAVPVGADVVICLDWDALDPAIMPAVIAPTAGGLRYRDLMALVGGVAARARIAGLAMVEFMPEADREGAGALTAGQAAASLVGMIAQQRARAPR